MRIPFTKKELRLFSLTDMDKAMDLLINGRPSATGVNVNQTTAMSCVTYFAGVRLISETIGKVPLVEYVRKNPRGKERATDRILYRLLHDEPNSEMSAMIFKETMQGHALTWGNAFAEIQWNPDGYPEALWPLRPDKMQVGRDDVTKELIYVYRLPTGETVKLPAYRVWHLPGFGFDGIIGYDTIYMAREAIGMALAMEEFGARFFSNGLSFSGLLRHPNKLSDPALKNLTKSIEDRHGGLDKKHRLMILEEGMDYKEIGIPPENAQFLESRKFQVLEICRLLNLKPHMLMDLERATFSNIEQQGIETVSYTMEPWFVRWEQTCNRKLLLPFEKPLFFFEFLRNALLRGDSTARANYYRERFYLGSLSPNDIRDLENENPIADEGADKYYVQQNMIPMELAGKLPAPQQPAQNKIEDVVRNIADRDYKNVLTAFKRDPDTFEFWLQDYTRDFKSFMQREITAAVGGNGHKEA